MEAVSPGFSSIIESQYKSLLSSFLYLAINVLELFELMKKVFAFAGVIAISIIPTPSFSGELEKKEMMSVTEQLLPQIGEKYNSLDKKEKKAYKKALNKYLKEIEKNGATGVSEAFGPFCPGLSCVR